MNCGPSFIKTYQKANPGVEVGIICWARGGSKIEEWHPKNFKRFDLYNEAVKQTHEALAQGCELKGVLWHQGEANSKNVADYPKLLKEHVTRLRAEFKKAELPFVFGQIGQWREDFTAFNKMIPQQVPEIPFSACVRSGGLTNFDAWHFDHRSQIELGRRYADKLSEITSTENN